MKHEGLSFLNSITAQYRIEPIEGVGHTLQIRFKRAHHHAVGELLANSITHGMGMGLSIAEMAVHAEWRRDNPGPPLSIVATPPP